MTHLYNNAPIPEDIPSYSDCLCSNGRYLLDRQTQFREECTHQLSYAYSSVVDSSPFHKSYEHFASRRDRVGTISRRQAYRAEEASIERDFEEAQAARISAQELLARCTSQWPAAMIGIGLGAGTSAVEADAAIAVWQSIPLIKSNYERDGRALVRLRAICAPLMMMSLVSRIAWRRSCAALQARKG